VELPHAAADADAGFEADLPQVLRGKTRCQLFS
jgi:hypothetical protein